MKNKISVIGLGYVGLTTAVCFSRLGYEVVGVDINPERIAEIKIGKNPLPKIQKLEGHLKEFPFEVYLDGHEKAIIESDITFVCIETPTRENGSINLTPIKEACRTIGKCIKEKRKVSLDKHLIVIRSTIFPGSLEILKKEIEKSSGKECDKDFDLAVNPEFLREIYAIDDFFNPCYVVVGADNQEVGEKVMGYYKLIPAKKFIVNKELAQMIKYVNNSWHSCKVVFTNEIGAICVAAGVNKEELMKLFCEDTKLNISPYYMKPGKAYGGNCLPKDLAVLQKKSKGLVVKVPLINSISKSNKIQEERDGKREMSEVQ